MKNDISSDSLNIEAASLCICTAEVVCPDEASVLCARQGLRTGHSCAEGPAIVLRVPAPALQPFCAATKIQASLAIATATSPLGQQHLLLFIQVGTVQLRIALELFSVETIRLVAKARHAGRLNVAVCSLDEGPLLCFTPGFFLADAERMLARAVASAWLSAEDRCLDMANVLHELARRRDNESGDSSVPQHVIVAGQMHAQPNPQALQALVAGLLFGHEDPPDEGDGEYTAH